MTRRKWMLGAAGLLVPRPAFAAWGIVAHGATAGDGGNPSTQTISGLNCTGATLLVCALSGWNGAGLVVPTYDIGGGPVSFGTVNATAQYDDGGAGSVGRLFWAFISGAASATIVSVTAYGSIYVASFSGVGSFVASNQSNNGTVSATATAASQLAITSLCHDTTQAAGTLSWTAPITPTIADQLAQNQGSDHSNPGTSDRSFGGALGYADTVNGSNQAVWAGFANSGSGIAIFDLGGGGGGSTENRLREISQ